MSGVSLIGRPVTAAPTPALVLDLDRFDRNVARMAQDAAGLGVAWRPHAKAHGNALLAQRQVAAGAIGATCATVAEAAAMVAGGIRSVLIANQVVTPQGTATVAGLQANAEVIVAVDSVAGADILASAGRRAGVRIPAIVEVDIGLGRAGVRDDDTLRALAAHLGRTGGLAPRGLMGYEGHTLDLTPPDAKQTAIETAIDRLLHAKQVLVQAGLPVDIVSCGGSGSYRIAGVTPGVTEIQAGGACLNDRFYAEACQLDGFEFALTVQATVVSRPEPDLAIIDAGMKAMSMTDGLPLPLCDGATVIDLFAEHGRLRLEGSAQALAVGDRISLIPGYSDSTTMLHRDFLAVRGEIVVSILQRATREHA